MVQVVMRGGYSEFLPYGKDVGSGCLIVCGKGVVEEVKVDVFLKKMRRQVDDLDVVPPDVKLPGTISKLVNYYVVSLKNGPKASQRFSRKSYAQKLVGLVGDMPAKEFNAEHWTVFSERLKAEEREGLRGRGSAQTYRAGAKHFVKWMIEKKKVAEFDL